MWNVTLFDPNDFSREIGRWKEVKNIDQVVELINEVLEIEGCEQRIKKVHLKELMSPAYQEERKGILERIGPWIKLTKIYSRTVKIGNETKTIVWEK